jgi:S1-C subfamily serine protease
MLASNHFHVLGVLALGLCLPGAMPVRADEAVYRKVAPSTALIFKSDGPFAGGAGTGFLVDAQRRWLVTARHVVANTGGGLAGAVVVVFAQTRDGALITDAAYYRKNWQTLAVRGKVIYESVRRDMAVLEVEKLPRGMKPLELAARPARPGQMVHIIGNSNQHFGGVFGYCQGSVRNAFRWEDLGAWVVATQVPTNKGDSGGPMVNNLGEVVGFAAMSTVGGNLPRANPFFDQQVTGLSICVTEIREALKELRSALALESPHVVILKGQARAGVHLVSMKKDVLYRIRVNGKGFVPDVLIDNIVINPKATSVFGPGNEWQQFFTPRETKEYRVQIGYWPGSSIGKGSFPYALSVEEATFVPETPPKEAQIKLNEHSRRLEAGKAYRITVRAKRFLPDVQVFEGSRAVAAEFSDGNPVNRGAVQAVWEGLGLAPMEFETALTFVAVRTADYRIVVAVGPDSPPGGNPLAYTVQIAEQKLHLSVSDQLTARDPRYLQGGPFKVHTVKLEGGKSYQIDLSTSAFDSCLLLEDSGGKLVMKGLDVDACNARLLFRPTRTGTYRVVASAHQIDATGPYRLTVVESPHAESGMRKLGKPR